MSRLSATRRRRWLAIQNSIMLFTMSLVHPFILNPDNQQTAFESLLAELATRMEYLFRSGVSVTEATSS